MLFKISKTSLVVRSLILVFLGYCGVASSADGDDRRANLPVYIEMQPAFVVNYIGYGDRLKYLKTNITLRASGIEGDTIVEANMPLVRDALVMYLSSLTIEDVTGAEAREAARQQSIIILNDILKKEVGQEPITDVLFTSFVTQ